MTCESFRASFAPGTEDPAVLEHLRHCDRCLDVAAAADPDVMFRAIGGEDLVPPGGIDAFVDGVMQQVRVRGAESALAASAIPVWPRRLAMAATVAAAVSGAVLINRINEAGAPAPVQIARATISAAANALPAELTTKPVVETYESSDAQNATIVEMPAERADDVKIVMIFDENLPADL